MSAPARQRYLYGGLRIDSELDFARLTPVARGDAASTDLKLRIADVGVTSSHGDQLYQWPGRFEMSLWRGSVGWAFRSARMDLEVMVSADGRELSCRAADPELLSEFVIRRVLPRVALLHGRLTVHAALARGSNGCLLLVGPSGAGKSTLSTALGQMEGWRQLSDDIAIVAADGRGVWASAPGAYLTQISSAGLRLEPSQGSADPSRSGKAWFPVGAPAHGAAPIAGLVFLQRSEDVRAPRLAPVSRALALNSLSSQFIRFDPSDPVAETRLFRCFAKAIRGFDSYALEYPSDYAALPAVGAELGKAGAHVRA